VRTPPLMTPGRGGGGGRDAGSLWGVGAVLIRWGGGGGGGVRRKGKRTPWLPTTLTVFGCTWAPTAGTPGPHEATVSLGTGRTHHVRLRMAVVGAPVVGDDRYAPLAGQAAVIGDADVRRGGDDGEAGGGEGRCLGLHAQSLAWEDEKGGGSVRVESVWRPWRRQGGGWGRGRGRAPRDQRGVC